MKHTWITVVAAVLASCLNSGAAQPEAENFDFGKYHQTMLEAAEASLNYRKSLDDMRFESYALIDIDGDGITEVWVKDDGGQDFSGVFAIHPDGNVELLENSDARSELKFHPSGLSCSGYYGAGESRGTATLVKDSRSAGYCTMRVLQDFNSPDEDVIEEDYCVDDKPATEAEYQAFLKKLGTPYEPQIQWVPVK